MRVDRADDPDRAFRVLPAEPAYLAAARGWRPGLPFPLLAPADPDRFRRLLGVPLPVVGPGPAWPGTVVSCGGEASDVVGGLLATATGRPHEHCADPRALRERVGSAAGPVAVLGRLPDLDAAGDWPGHWHPEVGVVTARDLATLTALVHRTVVLPRVRPVGTGTTLRIVHPTMPGAGEADVLSIEEMGLARAGRAAALVVRGHGRECCVHLPDAVVCGRSTPPEVALPVAAAGSRLPSCLQGGGCVRDDLDADERQPAAELSGAVVFVEACNAVTVGTNALPHEVNVALGFLDGVATAVVGPLGRHEIDPAAESIALGQLAAGRRLGAVVADLNRHVLATLGELSRFGLLGDPALVPPAPAPPPGPDPAAGGGTPADVAGSATRLLHELRSLDALPWVDVAVPHGEVGAVRAGVTAFGRALRSYPPPPATRLRTDLERLGARTRDAARTVVGDLLAAVHGSFWQFGGETMSELDLLASAALTCPHCGRDSGRALTMRHRVAEDLVVRGTFCRRCGPLTWEAGAGDEAAAVVPVAPVELTVAPGQPLRQDIELVNRTAREVRGTAGVGIVDGARQGLPPPRQWDLDLGPGARQRCRFEAPVPAAARPELHELVAVTLVEGIAAVAVTYLGVRR